MAVASAGPYANNLHLFQTDNHTNASSQAGCSSWFPTNSVKALKAILPVTLLLLLPPPPFYDHYTGQPVLASDPQLRTRDLSWSEVLLPASPC